MSFSLGAANSYALNSRFTFSSADRGKRTVYTVVKFAAVTLVCVGVSSATLFAASRAAPLIEAKLISVVATFLFGYLLNRFVVFSPGVPVG